MRNNLMMDTLTRFIPELCSKSSSTFAVSPVMSGVEFCASNENPQIKISIQVRMVRINGRLSNANKQKNNGISNLRPGERK